MHRNQCGAPIEVGFPQDSDTGGVVEPYVKYYPLRRSLFVVLGSCSFFPFFLVLLFIYNNIPVFFYNQ